ncbi:hypothetical protein GCHA_3265 [Paraglaciecola chathamensis S18K6]|uniref:Uncharacterized protein n=1 Tax=Paraglaciecola chathamensis S18K6 TaxID=1127672 RepID=A0AAV3V3A2_9ALTE|nr:hypothetical protein GCHA_3265 [Paraglaciecola chathamensis S18K6]
MPRLYFKPIANDGKTLKPLTALKIQAEGLRIYANTINC